jgi:hypothetical protein
MRPREEPHRSAKAVVNSAACIDRFGDQSRVKRLALAICAGVGHPLHFRKSGEQI